jgi:hypothetical protein
MRRYAIGLQLVVLICCAVASGYLWRAALGTGRTIRYVSAGKPYEPSWPALGSAGRVAVTHVPTRKPATHGSRPKAAPSRSSHAAPSTAAKAGQLASATARPESSPASSASAAAKAPDQNPPHIPTPTPPSPAAPSPPPPTPAPSPPSSSVRTPAASVTAGPTEKPDRPGWGRGDRNHHHTGPHAKPAKPAKTPKSPEPPEPAKPAKSAKPPEAAKAPKPPETPEVSDQPKDHGPKK